MPNQPGSVFGQAGRAGRQGREEKIDEDDGPPFFAIQAGFDDKRA